MDPRRPGRASCVTRAGIVGSTCVLGLVTGPTSATALQDPVSAARALSVPAEPALAPPTMGPSEVATHRTIPVRREPVSPGRALTFSIVLPGAGQYALGQRRAWLYLTAEAIGWLFYVDRRSAASDLEAAYRDFAWDRARIQSGPRQEGDFDYYETLTKWDRSGAWDTDPSAPGVQPESDSATFNGSIWERAVGLFLPDGPTTPPSDPRYQRALEYYAERGYGPDFLWDWGSDPAEQGAYASLISRSDLRARQATNVLGAILANHVLSAVDAWLSARGVSGARLRVGSRPVPSGTRWSADVRLSIGR